MRFGSYKYLSVEAVAAQERKKKTLLIVGGVLAGLCLFGLVDGLVDPASDLRQYAATYAIMMIPGLVILFFGILAGRLNDAARRYETIFAADRDGIVTVEELSGQMGMDPAKIFAELEKLFRKGYFRSCTLQRGGAPCVILSDAMMGEAGTGFVIVKCEYCGGDSRIRAGSRGQCSFCGAEVMDRRIDEQ